MPQETEPNINLGEQPNDPRLPKNLAELQSVIENAAKQGEIKGVIRTLVTLREWVYNTFAIQFLAEDLAKRNMLPPDIARDLPRILRESTNHSIQAFYYLESMANNNQLPEVKQILGYEFYALPENLDVYK